jgi:Zn-finger nucleic acid-binding protein
VDVPPQALPENLKTEGFLMQCPRCDANLTSCEFGATTIDGCSGCGGLWFDSQELNKLTRDPGVALMEVERTFDHALFASESEGDMQCPRCRRPLREFSFPHTPDVRLDACPECRGIWVDDGELGTIAKRISEHRPPTANSHSETVQIQARALTGFLLSVPCAKCNANNPSTCSACWGCGSALRPRAVCRLCPRCCQPLEEQACGHNVDTKVDVCLFCTGVWLQAGEITAFASLSLESVDDIQSCVVRSASSRMADSLADRPARCPGCHHVMERKQYGVRRRVDTDQCVNCQSLWLDAGELVAVYELIHAGEFAAADRSADPWADAE